MYKLRPTTIDGLKGYSPNSKQTSTRNYSEGDGNFRIVYSSVSQLKGVTLRTLFLKHCSHKKAIINRCENVIKIKIRVFLVYFLEYKMWEVFLLHHVYSIIFAAQIFLATLYCLHQRLFSW